jgi:hypothetical protein
MHLVQCPGSDNATCLLPLQAGLVITISLKPRVFLLSRNMSASALLLTPSAPPTYHRIVSDTLKIPTDHATSIPVGLLACQRRPYT